MMDTKELAYEIENTVNLMGNDEKMNTLVFHLGNMHRTLVQSFVGKFILPYVKKMANDYRDGYYDARNQFACELCSIMWNALKEKYDWIEETTKLPMI